MKDGSLNSPVSVEFMLVINRGAQRGGGGQFAPGISLLSSPKYYRNKKLLLEVYSPLLKTIIKILSSGVFYSSGNATYYF